MRNAEMLKELEGIKKSMEFFAPVLPKLQESQRNGVDESGSFAILAAGYKVCAEKLLEIIEAAGIEEG